MSSIRPGPPTAPLGVDVVSDAELTTALADYALVGAVPPPVRQRMTQPTTITSFASGHGWSSSGTGTFDANDTSDGGMATQCFKMVTNGSGAQARAQIIGASPVDLTDRDLIVWVKVNDWSLVNGIVVLAGTSSFAAYFDTDVYKGNIVAAATTPLASNEWTRLRFAFGTDARTIGSPDRSAITDFRIYATDKSTGAVTIRLGGLQSVPQRSDYPNGVVSFAFDDVSSGQYTNARQALAKWGYRATAYAIPDELGNSGYMTLTQLRELHDSYGWEVSAHARDYTTHQAWGAGDLTDAEADAECRYLRDWLMAQGFTGANHYAYPGGNTSYRAIAARYFATGRMVSSTPRQGTEVVNPMLLRALTITSSTTTTTITNEIDYAYENGGWLILLFHLIDTSGGTMAYTPADFATVIDYCHTKGIAVAPVGEVYQSAC